MDYGNSRLDRVYWFFLLFFRLWLRKSRSERKDQSNSNEECWKYKLKIVIRPFDFLTAILVCKVWLRKQEDKRNRE